MRDKDSPFPMADAPNPGGESFGLARLKDALDANTGASLSELKSAVLKTMHEFTETVQTHDDVTLADLLSSKIICRKVAIEKLM